MKKLLLILAMLGSSAYADYKVVSFDLHKSIDRESTGNAPHEFGRIDNAANMLLNGVGNGEYSNAQQKFHDTDGIADVETTVNIFQNSDEKNVCQGKVMFTLAIWVDVLDHANGQRLTYSEAYSDFCEGAAINAHILGNFFLGGQTYKFWVAANNAHDQI